MRMSLIITWLFVVFIQLKTEHKTVTIVSDGKEELMTKGQLIVAMTVSKANREGYPKLTENHPFFGRLRAFMVGKHYWMGTATDLLAEMNDTTTPANTVTKLLNKYSFELYCSSGIDVNFRRTNRRRIIEIRNHRQP